MVKEHVEFKHMGFKCGLEIWKCKSIWWAKLVKETQGTLGHCVYFSSIDAGSVLLPAQFFLSFWYVGELQLHILLINFFNS